MKGPKLFAVTSPSGGGKTSVITRILQKYPEITFSVSATTREKRPGETDGKEYFFLPKEEFESLIRTDELVEYEQLYQDYYGTLKREVDRALKGSHSMIFDVDVKGALSIRKHYPAEAVLIFIAPPSLEVLEQRLRNRKTESEEKLRRRLDRAAMEIETGKTFTHVVVNDELERTIQEIETIITSYL